MLNLTQLKVLEAVARHGSVTVAAKELHYSQPSISHHLGRLEAATGAKLIQRVGRGIRLTPEGQLLAGRATEILGRVNAASVELAARVGLRAGRVRPIGITLVRYAVTIHIAVIDHRPRRPMKQAQAAIQPTGRSATTARNSS
jgi:DNA-binding transcriptional LysR family regulator